MLPGGLIEILCPSGVTRTAEDTKWLVTYDLALLVSSDVDGQHIRHVYALTKGVIGWIHLYRSPVLRDSDYRVQWEPQRSEEDGRHDT